MQDQLTPFESVEHATSLSITIAKFLDTHIANTIGLHVSSSVRFDKTYLTEVPVVWRTCQPGERAKEYVVVDAMRYVSVRLIRASRRCWEKRFVFSMANRNGNRSNVERESPIVYDKYSG